ncbi:cyclic nucleotide-binding domain-containing protein 2-like [Actinia tenebrosa]|uniref:Cyclic nucleotide-binding domain-containing protein 2-like n=1 Tax=Actinia tenebrosa TaxID=6105 RepID=A0A6P8H707_ACTTE|nr:cyclic nucleotide-binding domain-containing protein 2-like [Actinia tenebrosa]
MLRNEIEKTVDTLEADEFVKRKTKMIFKDMGTFNRVSIRTQNKWAIENLKSLETRQRKGCRRLGPSQQEDEQRLTFNVNAFKSHVRPNFVLTKTTRQHLMMPRLKRTATHLKVFAAIIDNLKLFATYPHSVRQGLAKIANYEACEEGTVIVRQGDTGHSLYFILTGSVSVVVAEDDTNLHESRKQTVAAMFAGDMFGEVSLLHNIERTATIICRERSEFLRIDKPDFNMVLKTSYEEEWKSRVNYLRFLPEFQGFFSNKELQNAAANSKVVQYPENTVSKISVFKCSQIFQTFK